MTPVGPAQAGALAVIHAAAFPAAEAWSESVIALQLGVPGAFGFIDSRGGMILVRAIAGEAEVLTLAVLPSARRQGLGRALLCAAIRRATVIGAAEMFLEVAVSNNAAQQLYRTTGFQEVGRRRGYYADGTDALVMRRHLPPDVAGSAAASQQQ